MFRRHTTHYAPRFSCVINICLSLASQAASHCCTCHSREVAGDLDAVATEQRGQAGDTLKAPRHLCTELHEALVANAYCNIMLIHSTWRLQGARVVKRHMLLKHVTLQSGAVERDRQCVTHARVVCSSPAAGLALLLLHHCQLARTIKQLHKQTMQLLH